MKQFKITFKMDDKATATELRYADDADAAVEDFVLENELAETGRTADDVVSVESTGVVK